MFYPDYTSIESVKTISLKALDTSNVTNMSYMFYKCSNLTSIDFGDNFNTENVTTMLYMFAYCSALTELDVSNFNTANVKDMSHMFRDCYLLTELDVSKFNTQNVIYMSTMFYHCSALTELDLSSFNTEKVTSMSSMFGYCQKLESLDLSSFKTNNVIYMNAMFNRCSNLTNIDFGDNFNTEKVTNMSYMFGYCYALPELDVSTFNTTNVKDMSHMFRDCHSLTKLDLSNFNTQNVTSMGSMFYYCSALTELNISNFNTEKVTTMSTMFQNCKKLRKLDLSTFNTSNVIYMTYMLASNDNLESIVLGDDFNISNATSIDHMFYNCPKLKTIEGSIKLGETNAVKSFSSLFSGSYSLKTVTFDTPQGGATFPNLSSMYSMFYSCSSLESIDLGNWVLPNLTNANTMFFNCSSLTNLDLSWSGLRAQSGDFSVNSMFSRVPSTATLESGTETSPMMQEIRNIFTGTVLQDGKPINLSIVETPETAVEESEDIPVVLPELPTEDIPVVLPEFPTEDTVETPVTLPETYLDENTAQNEITNDKSLVMAANILPLSNKTTYTDEQNSSVYVHPDMVKAYDTINYKVTVKYVGDIGAKSGLITLNFPIPDKIKQFQGTAENGYTDAGWYVSTTEIVNSGSPTGYIGGRVVEEPSVKQLPDGSYALQGVFEGLYTGTEISVSIKTTLQENNDYNNDGYAFWDGTAYATDNAGTASSRTVRLWNKQDNSTAPPANSYQLSYAFTGDVPNDVKLPQSTVVEDNASVTAEAAPLTSLDGYTFDGWYRSDDNSKVEPNSSFTMPSYDLTLIGKWTLNPDKIQKITVKYEYTNNNDGHHIPDGVPILPSEQSVKVGQTHYIQKISQDASYHKFGGWVPTLSIDGTNIPLTKQNDGTYKSSDGAYTIDISGGSLSTEQFRGKTDVIVTFGGAWTPYKGTIKFDANGGEGNMNDMTNVTWDTTQTLSQNTFTHTYSGYEFVGWAITPSGNVVKTDQATADGLIDKDGKTVTLYAVWKQNTYSIAYDLKNVSSSNNDVMIAFNSSYSTTLTADTDYEINNVSVTMGGVNITSGAYDEKTGQISINNINGNIIIKADAIKSDTDVEDNNTTKYTVNVQSIGNGTATADKNKAESGEDIIITTSGTVESIIATDENGNEISLTADSGHYTFKMPNSDVNVKVKFEIANPDSTGVSNSLNTEEHIAYLNGYDTGIFAPDNNMTRAEVT